jgi:hypothetical protein
VSASKRQLRGVRRHLPKAGSGERSRLAAKTLFAHPGRQFLGTIGRMLADTLEHIGQGAVRIKVVQPAGDDQALEVATCLALSSVQQDGQLRPLRKAFHKGRFSPLG